MLLEEQPLANCIGNIDEMLVPNMPTFENVVAKDIIDDMQGFLILVSELEHELASFIQA